MLAECLPDDGGTLFAIFGGWMEGCGMSPFSLSSESSMAHWRPARGLLSCVYLSGTEPDIIPPLRRHFGLPGDPIAFLAYLNGTLATSC